MWIFIGRNGTDLCPVAAVLRYMACRGTQPGPLFVFSDGYFLTRKKFVELVRAALAAAGIDQQKYCGHSFRIGAATTAAAKGVEDSIIKTLGRWESVAYLQYVRIPRSQLRVTLVCWSHRSMLCAFNIAHLVVVGVRVGAWSRCGGRGLWPSMGRASRRRWTPPALFPHRGTRP